MRTRTIPRLLGVVGAALVVGGACATSIQLDESLTAPVVAPASPTPRTEPTAAAEPTPNDTGSASGALEVGQCYTATELASVEGVAVPCNEPHVAEVFAVTDLEEPEGATWPGLGEVQDRASDFCNGRFGELTGVAGDVSAVPIMFFRPDQDGWAGGDRQVACFVEYPEEITTPLAELDPLRSFGLVSTFGLMTGDCVADESLVDSVAVSLVDCAETHWFEVYESAEMPDGPYPGEDEILDFANSVCEPAFETFVGVQMGESSLQVERLFPTEESWEQWDDRLVSCVVTGGEPRTGSAAGTGS